MRAVPSHVVVVPPIDELKVLDISLGQGNYTNTKEYCRFDLVK